MYIPKLHQMTAVLGLAALSACADPPTQPDASQADVPVVLMQAKSGPPDGMGETTAGSNLSFPTVWAEGVSKNPRGTMGTVSLGGDWWYWWGEPLVEGGDPLSCEPDPLNTTRCSDGSSPGSGAVRAYLQKQESNEWQADNATATAPVHIDRIDWGDAIESVSWTIKSKVRLETTLFEDVAETMTGYTMRHTSGHGIDEMWGVDAGTAGAQALTYESPEAIVFSPCARLTIQKLLVDRETLSYPVDPRLSWNASTGLWQGSAVSDAAVFTDGLAPEGPGGGFGAEINIQGKIVYGMTWDVKTMNNGVGDYRVTFSLDDANCSTALLNTFITAATEIIVPEEEEVEVTITSAPGEGGTAYVDGANNLTFIDLRITLKETGKGGGGGGGGGNGGGGKRGSGGPGGPR